MDPFSSSSLFTGPPQMPLETATYISDLNVANPAHGDQLNLDDSHARLIKSTIKATFPNFTAVALAATQAQLDAAVLATTTTLPAHFPVVTADIAAGAVTAAKIATDAVVTAGILAANVTTAKIADANVTTAKIADTNVTYAKIQNVASLKLLGNPTGGAAAPSEIGVGAGLVVNAGNLTSPAFPPAGVFKNLVIKVLTNTTVSVTADYVTTTDGTNFLTTPVNTTVNLATNGGVAALEGSLTIAASTWYRLWVITKPDGTTSVLANTSDSTITTFPTGYTAKARVGQVNTDGASQLFGTWQFGRIAKYIAGLAKTTVPPLMVSGAVTGTFSFTSPTLVAVSVTRFAPSTASIIKVAASTNSGALLAPSALYSGTNNGPIGSNGFSTTIALNVPVAGSETADILLESTSVYFCCDNTSGKLACIGWEDNI